MHSESTINVIPRMADLDTQRHVTSRAYEAFCWEGRMCVLADVGFPLDRILAEHWYLEPRRMFVRFVSEQKPGAQLQVKTHLDAAESDARWTRTVSSPDYMEIKPESTP